MLTKEQIKRIEAKAEECFRTCERHFNQTFVRPAIRYTLRGTTAGTADSRNNILNFHPVLAAENFDAYLARTVPHEVAHLVDFATRSTDGFDGRMGGVDAFRWSGRTRRQKREAHGPRWKAIMRLLGAEETRCHSFDTSNVARRKSRHEYVCDCGHKYSIGPTVHRKIQSGISYTCRKCKLRLRPNMFNRPTGLTVPPVPKHNPEVPAPRIPAAISNAGSKIDQAVVLVRNNRTMPRARMIDILMHTLNMSKAGASTYYYQAVKRIGA